MLFYVALAIACIIAALLSIWLFRMLSLIGRQSFQAILPTAKRKKPDRFAHLHPTLTRHFQPSPRLRQRESMLEALPGWNSYSRYIDSPEQSSERIPWGWQGRENHLKAGRYADGRGVLASSGSGSNQRRRRKKASRGGDGKDHGSKPWGW